MEYRNNLSKSFIKFENLMKLKYGNDTQISLSNVSKKIALSFY